MIDTNYNDIFIRNATLALLELLRTELFIEQYDDGKVTKHPITFMVSAGNSEQFMKDFFSDLPAHCRPTPMAEGNYDKLPLGIIHLAPQVQIITKDLTNKFVRAQYVEHEKGKNDKKVATGYNARLLALPLSITFQLEIRVSTLNHLFKVFETVMDTFFQNRVQYFQFKGMRIQSQLKFPENAEMSKTEQFDFSTTENHTSLKFSVEMETYYPSFDKSSKMKAANVIEHINYATKESNSGQILGDKNGAFLDQDNKTE